MSKTFCETRKETFWTLRWRQPDTGEMFGVNERTDYMCFFVSQRKFRRIIPVRDDCFLIRAALLRFLPSDTYCIYTPLHQRIVQNLKEDLRDILK